MSDAADRAATAPDSAIEVLRDLDARLRACFGLPVTAEEAYDSSYQEIVAAALTAPDRAANSLAAPDEQRMIRAEIRAGIEALALPGFHDVVSRKGPNYLPSTEDRMMALRRAAAEIAAPSVPPVGVGREAEHGSVDSVAAFSPPAAALGHATAHATVSEISALRWLLNITTEPDRKDVGTKQAARLLDEYGNADNATNRELLESLWRKLIAAPENPDREQHADDAPFPTAPREEKPS